MRGHYITGINKGHRNNRKAFFPCSMQGTFNIQLDSYLDVDKLTPILAKQNTEYYLVKLTKDKKSYYCYLLNWKLSKLQNRNIIEIVSKQLLPDTLKEGTIDVEVLVKWSNDKRDGWAESVYWWQTFDWSPKKRANSKELFDTINKEIDWAGLTVLDIGSHYGYHSFNASKRGAIVTGIEINNSALAKSKLINDHIEMQDVSFYKRDDETKKYDVILYLSVHHQIDKSYSKLKETLDNYKARCNKYFVVELILNPMFGKNFTNAEIDKIVGGKILHTYQHKVRGIRRLYLVKK